jgi:hypothetical protein
MYITKMFWTMNIKCYCLVNCTSFIGKLLSPYERLHLKEQYKWNISTIILTSIGKSLQFFLEVTAWRTNGVASKSTVTGKLVPKNLLWPWCTHCKWYASELPLVTTGIKYLFNHGTKDRIPVSEKIVSRLCRQNATSCFRLASVAKSLTNHLFLQGSKCMEITWHEIVLQQCWSIRSQT